MTINKNYKGGDVLKNKKIFKRKPKFEIELEIHKSFRGGIEVEQVIELIKKTREKFNDADLKIRLLNN